MLARGVTDSIHLATAIDHRQASPGKELVHAVLLSAPLGGTRS